MEGFFEVRSGALLDAADVGQIEGFIPAVVVGGSDAGALHLVRLR